jgi:hypothetical protein
VRKIELEKKIADIDHHLPQSLLQMKSRRVIGHHHHLHRRHRHPRKVRTD